MVYVHCTLVGYSLVWDGLVSILMQKVSVSHYQRKWATFCMVCQCFFDRRLRRGDDGLREIYKMFGDSACPLSADTWNSQSSGKSQLTSHININYYETIYPTSPLGKEKISDREVIQRRRMALETCHQTNPDRRVQPKVCRKHFH